MFNAVIIQVVHRRLVDDGLEVAAEIFRRHAGNLGQLLKADTGGKMVLDIFKYGPELFHMAER